MTTTHPAYMALLRHCTHSYKVDSQERDAILRSCFPELVATSKQYEATLAVLKEAWDLHHTGQPFDAVRVLESLVEDSQKLRFPTSD